MMFISAVVNAVRLLIFLVTAGLDILSALAKSDCDMLFAISRSLIVLPIVSDDNFM